MLLSQRVSRAEHFSRPAFDAEMSQFENNEVGLSVFVKCVCSHFL